MIFPSYAHYSPSFQGISKNLLQPRCSLQKKLRVSAQLLAAESSGAGSSGMPRTLHINNMYNPRVFLWIINVYSNKPIFEEYPHDIPVKLLEIS